jgi:hypothetical protein
MPFLWLFVQCPRCTENRSNCENEKSSEGIVLYCWYTCYETCSANGRRRRTPGDCIGSLQVSQRCQRNWKFVWDETLANLLQPEVHRLHDMYLCVVDNLTRNIALLVIKVVSMLSLSLKTRWKRCQLLLSAKGIQDRVLCSDTYKIKDVLQSGMRPCKVHSLTISNRI